MKHAELEDQISQMWEMIHKLDERVNKLEDIVAGLSEVRPERVPMKLRHAGFGVR